MAAMGIRLPMKKERNCPMGPGQVFPSRLSRILVMISLTERIDDMTMRPMIETKMHAQTLSTRPFSDL